MKSTFAGQTLACSVCLHDLILLSNLLREMVGTRMPVTLRTDCASLFDHIYLQKAVAEKHLLIELAVICDAFKNSDLTILGMGIYNYATG